MTKKKVVTFFAVSALCGVMAIGSSMAYLTDHDSVTNKFSVGKVDIEGQEPNYTPDPDGKTNNILPTQVIKKDPQIKNVGKNDAYVYIDVSIPIAKVITVDAAGNRLKWEGTKGAFYKVAYPDGRQGYISKSISMPEKKWRATLKQDAASIIATAHSMMGIPYLWAGTSSKGVDCSGFMRTVLFMHDIIIPRDASQQAYVGEHIDIAPDFSNLQPGDLIFFGRKATPERKERVVHVGMYIGNKRFIHSQGDVRVNSFSPDDELFDEYNLGRLLFATRVLPYINKEASLNTTETNPFYSM